MKTQVLVYQGEGADVRSLRMTLRGLKQELSSAYKIERINTEQLLNTDWEQETKMLVFPGGRDLPYHQKLSGCGTDKIRAYVMNGGVYLGLCAGGYFGASSICFEEGHALALKGARDLKFFPGVAKGPVYDPGTFSYAQDTNARIAKLDSGSCFFNGGCAFLEAERFDGVRVLARYADVEGTPAAIVVCEVGLGRAVLCGVHPEFSAAGWVKPNERVRGVVDQLKVVEDERRILWQDVLELCITTQG